MLSKQTVTFLFAFILFQAKAQTPINTDRPDQTETPFIVPRGFFQVETGFSYENATKNTKSITHPSVLWKYGATEKFEFRLITERVTEKNYKETVTGLLPVTIGFKVNVTEEKGILPTISFLGHLTVPDAASQNFKSVYHAPAFRFSMQHTLSDKVTLGYNLGAEWDGETPEPTFIYTLTTGFSITKKLGSYLEIYGFAPQKQTADHRFDAGLSYLINNNVLVDLSGGFGITDNAPKNYGAVGFSFRLDTKHKIKN